jgi:DNA-binding NarL/FixJ family response regulator
MNGRKIRLLIVDDIAETREIIRRLLQFEPDIEVVGGAKDGEEAVQLYEELRPDVVSMDIHMPNVDGVTATRTICARHSDARIIVLTVNNSFDIMRLAAMAGAVDYMLKPPDPDEFISAIRRAAAAYPAAKPQPHPPAEPRKADAGDGRTHSPTHLSTRILGSKTESRAELLRHAGEIALEFGNNNEAFDAFTEALLDDPLDYWAWLGKAVALSRGTGWERRESEVFAHLTQALGIAENSTCSGSPPSDFAKEFAARSEEVISRYFNAYAQEPLCGGSLRLMYKEHLNAWGVSPSEQARRLRASGNAMDELRQKEAARLLDVEEREARTRFYLSSVIGVSWAVLPTPGGGCLVAELLRYWWMIRWKGLLGIRSWSSERQSRAASGGSENLLGTVQAWLNETNAELRALRQQLDSDSLLAEKRFSARMAHWVLEIGRDPRGYRNEILETTAVDLREVASALYPECEPSLVLPREDS